MSVKQTLAEWGINAVGLVAGLLGGVIAVVMNDKEIHFKSAIAQILSAVGFSAYGTEIVVGWLGWSEKVSTIGLLGMCLGLSGILFAKGVLKIASNFSDNPFSFINKNKGNDTDD